MYTTSSIFLKSLADAGITHAFVNWGSDHPALLEDLERQRIEDRGRTRPEIVTCPNEMVALSTAQGYAQVTGKPAAVIIHVDVGTQALAGAIHNVDRSRTPVFIYAGASPFSARKELKGSRNEWIMWLQDVPDQTAIVRQYMRYTAQINSSSTASQYIRRSLQIATSDPKGPVYLWARREVMEEEVPESSEPTHHSTQKWPSIEPSGLSPSAATQIGSALLSARFPLIITSSLGRNPHAVPALLALSQMLAIPVFITCPSVINIPFSHPYFAGISFLAPGTHYKHLKSADTILVIDSDIPWIPANDQPSETTRVFVLDGGDPLKRTIGFWHVDAELICNADAELALGQITEALRKMDEQGESVWGHVLRASGHVEERRKMLEMEYKEMVRALDEAEEAYPVLNGVSIGRPPVTMNVPNIVGVLRRAVQELEDTNGREFKNLFLNESISNYPMVWKHLRGEAPGSILSSGGSSLGWALGAAVGAHIGGEVVGGGEGKGYDLISVIVGDGSFMFGVPSSAFWMARKYNTPFLTIVLNNGGWKSPKLSMLGVYPDGYGSKATGDELSVGFGPDCPDYSEIAVAATAGWAWGKRVGVGKEGGKGALERAMAEAIKVVVQEHRCAVVDCLIESF